MYEVTYKTGYEYHDDYIPMGKARVIRVEGPDVYNMTTAERAALDRIMPTLDPDGWVQIVKIEHL